MKLAQAFLVGAALATSPAFAAAAQADAAPKLPPEMVQGKVHYVSGGVGHDEAQIFERAERHYPLSLEFAKRAKPRNEFTADVKVVIHDAKGRIVLDAVSTGPFLLAKLPAGRYDVKATQDGKTIEHRATVAGGKPAHVDFLWPAT